MENASTEWSKVLQAANSGDGFAVDHLVEGKLKGILPAFVEEAFEEQCFLFWSRDGEYTEEIRAACTAHDPLEPAVQRDVDVVVLDVRFIDPSSAHRFLGIGMEGEFAVSVTYHAKSAKSIRVLIWEEDSREDGELYVRVRGWEASGFKLVREWTPRTRVSSARTRISFGKPESERPSILFKGRSVCYTIKTSEQIPQNKSATGVKRGNVNLTLRVGLREPVVGSEDDLVVMRVQAECIVVPEVGKGVKSVRVRSVCKIGGSQGSCSLVDGNSGHQEEGATDYCNWKYGGDVFDCGRTHLIDSARQTHSLLRPDTLWMLSSKGLQAVTVATEHEMGESEGKVGIKARLSRLFSDESGNKLVTCSRHLRISVRS
ncbi:hypothetical protein KFL_007780040 [Klebsormidium nitens]|uniref:Uncharacterized protein n=1 Tax=Klebsormidium nitens TaxID=105231 RepID=A0A1Y1IRN0_KLENI|nr:hypothetical protein KFL_007780040 [Klebsormidium nitens]|eukprot:GAQ91396.1 hypothetical protein KFL_007780040 [Klebsormidium nitens]